MRPTHFKEWVGKKKLAVAPTRGNCAHHQPLRRHFGLSPLEGKSRDWQPVGRGQGCTGELPATKNYLAPGAVLPRLRNPALGLRILRTKLGIAGASQVEPRQTVPEEVKQRQGGRRCKNDASDV